MLGLLRGDASGFRGLRLQVFVAAAGDDVGIGRPREQQ